jgi:uncharacterized protein involved in exopolysaccharide biosynthesis
LVVALVVGLTGVPRAQLIMPGERDPAIDARARDDHRATLRGDLRKREDMLRTLNRQVAEAESNVMQARQALDQAVAKGAAPPDRAPSGARRGTPVGGGTAAEARRALESASYQLQVLRADQRSLQAKVVIIRESLAR